MTNDEIVQATGIRAFFANISANYATEETYGYYDKFKDTCEWDTWYFWPFSCLTDDYHKRTKQKALAFRCRAVIMRDRAENVVFNGEE